MPSQGCFSPWTWHPPACTVCLVAKASDLLMDKSVSIVRQQACLPAALPARWEDRMCCRDQPSNADMKSEGSAGRPGAGLVEGSDMALMLERQAQTLPTPVTHSYFFTSPPETSPLFLPLLQSLSSNCAALPGAGQSHNTERGCAGVWLWTPSWASSPTS